MEDINTSEIVRKYGFKFTKSLGQNFLIDNTVLDDILRAADVCREDFVIEIGPGVGTLTRRLLSDAKKVCAVEIDSRLIPILKEELKEFNNFVLIHKDALKTDFNELIAEEKSVKVVANLPYYVTTPIISKFLTGNYNFKTLTIMIQKEVADRIAAKPNCKEYGALSLLVQYYCEVEVIRRVMPESFLPQPKVESTVIKLIKLSAPKVKVKDEKLFFTIIRSAFNMRRKTLWNALKILSFSKEDLEAAFLQAQIDPKRRGETLSIKEFANLSDAVFELKN